MASLLRSVLGGGSADEKRPEGTAPPGSTFAESLGNTLGSDMTARKEQANEAAHAATEMAKEGSEKAKEALEGAKKEVNDFVESHSLSGGKS